MQGFDDRTQKNKQQDASQQPKQDTLLHAALLAQLEEEYGRDAAGMQENAVALEHEFSPAFQARISSLIAQADEIAERGREAAPDETKKSADRILSLEELQEAAQAKEEKEREKKVISRDTLAARRKAREEQRQRAHEANERMAGALFDLPSKKARTAKKRTDRSAGRSARRCHARSLVQAASVLLLLGIFVFGAERAGFLRGQSEQSAVPMEAAAGKTNREAERAAEPNEAEAAQEPLALNAPAAANASEAAGAPYAAENGSAYSTFSERIAKERSAEPLPGTAAGEESQPETAGNASADADAPALAKVGPVSRSAGGDEASAAAKTQAPESETGAGAAAYAGRSAAEPDTKTVQLSNPIQEVSGTEAFKEQLGLIVPFGTAYRSDIRCSIIDGETAQIQYYSENLRSDVSYRAGKAKSFYDEAETKQGNAGTDTSSAGANGEVSDEVAAGRLLAGVYYAFDESLTEHWGAYWSGEAAGVSDPANAGNGKSTGYLGVTVCFPKAGNGDGALAVWQIDDTLYSLWVSDASYAPDAVGKEAVSLIESGT